MWALPDMSSQEIVKQELSDKAKRRKRSQKQHNCNEPRYPEETGNSGEPSQEGPAYRYYPKSTEKTHPGGTQKNT